MQERLIENEAERRRTTSVVSTERSFQIPIPEPYPFTTNTISTSKYNCLTFLPKNLWNQFHKLANIYFLVVAVLQSIPAISVSGGVPNILLPLVFVMTVSAIKDLVEDLKRKRSDKEENVRQTHIRVGRDWRKVTWQEVRVGDIIRVKKDEYFPADIILLNTSDAKGICYIETKNLDGETNLKHKSASKDTQTHYEEDSKFDGLEATVRCEGPNPMIYQFNGLLTILDTVLVLASEQLLLRGSSLKNTDWITGIVVYTGHESKIMLNSPKSRAKASKLESQMNRQVIYIFFLQLGICVYAATFYAIWFDTSKSDTEQYLELDKSNDNAAAQFILQFFSWMLIFTNFVPISLLVTLEMVKFIQAIFIAWDLKLYYEPTDTPAKVQSSNLNEELGQINYVFSDKTGTLTCNIMEFRKFTIDGKSYGSNKRTPLNVKMPHVDFVDPNFDKNHPAAHDFLMHLATCHTIITENKDGEIEYKASSPDELALANAAKFFGYKFLGRDQDLNVILDVEGEEMKLNVLNVLEFSSDRKRMSVIVRMPDKKIKVLCKGADSILLPRLKQSETLDMTWMNLEEYANEGLRTLVLTSRDLTEAEYIAWNEKYSDALKDIHNREKRVAEVSEEIETQLTLLGATAIEDRLQDNVPETIKFLREAGINVWVLTGDKVETAINIGFSCNLITSEMVRIIVQSARTQEVQEELQKGILSTKAEPSSKFVLVITGDALIKAVRAEIKPLLMEITDSCNVVLACRVSPQQKADIVKLIRDSKASARTLAIGDGANDVNMITAAHVGIGISGLEGQQAVRASDYAVAQFSYLKRLMFVHGRECYRRNATLICYNFYKNVLLVMPIFFYGFFTVYSGQLLYNQWTYQVFNIIFAALPIVIYAVFDKEAEYETLENDTNHYKLGLKGRLFTTSAFWFWILEATLQACAICLISIFAICTVSGEWESGRMDSMWVYSVLVLALVIIVCNVKIILFSYIHFWFSLIIIALSILLYFLVSAIITEWLPMESFLDNYDGKGSTARMLKNPNSYLCMILITYFCFFMTPLIYKGVELTNLLRGKVGKVKDVELPEDGTDIDAEEEERRDRVLSELPVEDRLQAQESLSYFRRRHTGFAFSGEAGHAPQLTENLIYRTSLGW
ncbi:unnamed protein product [Blepharisma stoltei]|uniref:Phospholipid-transporting ATPase n=1 Tax=Blepharisma stoltei TaxID=1481888 RepID=A0AAU9JM19_9CILI|nr:unnamed protein product [Blepharisma stoltei]